MEAESGDLDEKKTKISWKILAVVITVSLIFGGSLFYIFGYEWRKTSYSFDYIVDIGKTGDGNYTVIVPFPYFDSDETYWSDHVLFGLNPPEGTTVLLVEEQFGTGLRIDTSESVSLECSLERNVPCQNLSLTIETDERHSPLFWMYSSFSDGVQLEVLVRMENYRTYTSKRAGELDGWGGGGGPCVGFGDFDHVEADSGWNQYQGFSSALIIN